MQPAGKHTASVAKLLSTADAVVVVCIVFMYEPGGLSEWCRKLPELCLTMCLNYSMVDPPCSMQTSMQTI